MIPEESARQRRIAIRRCGVGWVVTVPRNVDVRLSPSVSHWTHFADTFEDAVAHALVSIGAVRLTHAKEWLPMIKHRSWPRPRTA